MTPLHRRLLAATCAGYLASVICLLVDAPGNAVVQIVAGLLGLALGLLVGLDVKGTATYVAERHRATVGGEQPLDSVTGLRVVHLVLFGGLGLLQILLGVVRLL